MAKLEMTKCKPQHKTHSQSLLCMARVTCNDTVQRSPHHIWTEAYAYTPHIAQCIRMKYSVRWSEPRRSRYLASMRAIRVYLVPAETECNFNFTSSRTISYSIFSFLYLLFGPQEINRVKIIVSKLWACECYAIEAKQVTLNSRIFLSFLFHFLSLWFLQRPESDMNDACGRNTQSERLTDSISCNFSPKQDEMSQVSHRPLAQMQWKYSILAETDSAPFTFRFRCIQLSHSVSECSKSTQEIDSNLRFDFLGGHSCPWSKTITENDKFMVRYVQ